MTSTMTASCSYLFSSVSGSELAKGEAELKLEEDKLLILPKFEESLTLYLIDIGKIVPGDYRLELTLSSGEKITVLDLGYKFGDFVSNLFHLRNEIILKYLLMNETIRRSGIWGDLIVANPAGAKKEFEKCEIRLYETSLVFLPTVDDPIRVHYSNVKQVENKDYSISINAESGEQFTILRLGREFESTSRDLSTAINTVNNQTQSLLKELAPAAEPSAIMALSRIMKDGKAANVQEIKSISPITWNQFEKSLEQTSIWSGYQYLQSFARQEKISVGLKRGLMGDLTGNYIWLLIPIFGSNQEYGNAVALEAARLPTVGRDQIESAGELGETDSGGATGGNATYFFRIVGRKEYAALATNMTELDAKVDSIIKRISGLMMNINFRREPIFLSEEQLSTESKYARYRYAVQKIPSLRELRQLFIGRVIHSSSDQWKSDVTGLLGFNNSAKDDARWEK